jgi:hypothetical protein
MGKRMRRGGVFRSDDRNPAAYLNELPKLDDAEFAFPLSGKLDCAVFSNVHDKGRPEANDADILPVASPG